MIRHWLPLESDLNYQIQDSGSIALILNYKDRTTLDELGFGENTRKFGGQSI